MPSVIQPRLSPSFLRRRLTLAAVVLTCLPCACKEDEPAPELAGPRNLVPAEDEAHLPTTHTSYVSVYSSLAVAERARPFDMVVTLSLRNVSSHEQVVVSSVDYYDSDGKRVRSYLDRPHTLGPLQTAEFVIEGSDRSGGSGANFLVKWRSTSTRPDLLVEAVHHGRDGGVGLAFTTEGRLVDEPAPAPPS